MRYIRQEILKEIGKNGQNKLSKSIVAIVGVGALGTVSSELLARAGIGKLILIDRDFVELSNLQRQSLFDESDIGKPKAFAAKEKLAEINSEIKVEFYIDDLDYKNIGTILKNVDLILDCTDNLETRYLLNDYCVKNKKTFIYSAGVGTKGYGFVVSKNGPCIRCFLNGSKSIETCETTGVLSTLTHIVASVQATETVKVILGKDFEKNLLSIDAWNNEITKIKINKRKNCECCVKNNFEYFSGKKSSKTVKLCGQNMFQIKNPMTKNQYNEIKNKLKKLGKVVDFDYYINFGNKLTLFNDGRALIKAKDEKEAKSIYSKWIGN